MQGKVGMVEWVRVVLSSTPFNFPRVVAYIRNVTRYSTNYLSLFFSVMKGIIWKRCTKIAAREANLIQQQR
jgi:hypothetical protein